MCMQRAILFVSVPMRPEALRLDEEIIVAGYSATLPVGERGSPCPRHWHHSLTCGNTAAGECDGEGYGVIAFLVKHAYRWYKWLCGLAMSTLASKAHARCAQPVSGNNRGTSGQVDQKMQPPGRVLLRDVAFLSFLHPRAL